MSENISVSVSNGADHSQANGQVDSGSNATESVKNPEAVLAKNKELVALLAKQNKEKQELLSRLQEKEQAQLQAEGKKDELIAILKKEKSEIAKMFAETKAKYAHKSVSSQVALKAKELGCVDTDLLTKAIDLETLQVSLVDDDYNVDGQGLMAKLEEIRKTKPFLFKQSGPQIRDGVPSGKVDNNQKVDFTKLSPKELIELARKMESQT